LNGTDGAQLPFWSPDSRSVGFFANSKLKRVDIDGGVQTLAEANNAARGGSWSKDGVILFAPAITGLFRIQRTGGQAPAVTTLAARQTSHRFPQFLPDGRRFLFIATGNQEAAGIYIGALDRSEVKRLTFSDNDAQFLPPDNLVYLRQS